MTTGPDGDEDKHHGPAPADASRRLSVRVLTALNRIYARAFHDLRVLSPSAVPAAGAAILVCNHTSGLDPLLIQAACPRHVTWMMAKEYYDAGAVGWVSRQAGAIAVARSGRDLAAMRAGMRALGAGRLLGVFPEGRIEPWPGTDLLPFQTGVALIAIRTGAPVFPAYLDGTQRGRDVVPALVNPNRVTLAFGPEVAFDRGTTDRASLDAATEKIRLAIEELRRLTVSAGGGDGMGGGGGHA